MPRAVLIGGTGLIGRAAARALAEDGWDVVAVSRSGTLPEGLAELGVESVVADRGTTQSCGPRSGRARTSSTTAWR